MGTLSVDKLMKTSTGAAEFTLPATDGTANQVMQTDGSGQLSIAALAANTVGTTQIADNAVTANKLGDSAWRGNRNMVINGQYDVWQRGTTITVSANANIHYADQWRHEGFAFTGSVTRQTFTNGQTDVPDNPTYFSRLIITTNSSGYQAFVQRIENNPVNRFSGKTLTVSFWIKSASGTLADGTVRAYGKSALDGSGTDNIGAITTSWQKIEYTGTLGNQTGTYYTVGLHISQGTLLTSGVDIANFQVEVGDTATPFEQKTYNQELQACLRYYQIVSINWWSYAISASVIDSFVRHTPYMRASPSVTLLDTTPTFQKVNVANVTGVSSSITTSNNSDRQAFVRIDGFSGLTSNSDYLLVSADMFAFSAEL